MKKLILLVIALCIAPVSLFAASEHGVVLQEANIDLGNTAALQRGAKYFVNYCLGCHGLKYARYNRLGKDLGISDELVMDNLIFTSSKLGETMITAMTDRQGEDWFGVAPPDLTLTARSRGADWVYTYLKSFYIDESRPFGVNNLIFDKVSMPHVLWELQGLNKAVHKTVERHGEKVDVTKFEPVIEGTLTDSEYDKLVRDLTTFMIYVSEPAQLQRTRIGIWVILFLIVLFAATYMMKKEYWRDVH